MSLKIQSFTFNPFEENTYIISASNGECIIIDPGCFDQQERQSVLDYIMDNQLKPVRLINTHCHIDHILGNAFVAKNYNLKLEIHKGEQVVLQAQESVANMYSIDYELSPAPSFFLEEGDTITLGGLELLVLFTPGHSPASICFYCESEGWLIGGDVLFFESIGRTDLPGGDHQTLLQSIRTQLFVLPDETIVYPGHGEPTKIGYEKRFNPFLK